MDTKPAELMRQIAECSFALLDLQLYLDTHPADAQAQSDYAVHNRQLGLLKEQYISAYAPQNDLENAACGGEWQWYDQPWPWDIKGRE